MNLLAEELPRGWDLHLVIETGSAYWLLSDPGGDNMTDAADVSPDESIERTGLLLLAYAKQMSRGPQAVN